MFDASVYKRRRQELIRRVGSGLVLLTGNTEAPMNYAGNTYPFRQDSTFLYYFGIDVPNLHALIDTESGEEIVFGDDFSLDDIIWMGDLPGVKELAEQAGVAMSSPLSELPACIRKAQTTGRHIHVLPPYRSEQQQLLRDLLGEKHSEASLELIKAVVAQRSVKSPQEIEEIETAHAITYKMQEMAMKMAQPGITEREVFGRINGIAFSKGAGSAFPVILSVRGEILHNHHHDNIMKKGDLLINDCGAESLLYYAADITRTIPVSGKFTTRQREIYEIVLDAQTTAIDAMQPGTLYRDVHLLAARRIAEGLKALGLMKGDVSEAVAEGAHALFFPHGLGHMMGLDVHDMENLGEDHIGYTEDIRRSTQFGLAYLRLAKALQPGFVVTVEPGLYFIPALIEKWESEKQHSRFINYTRVKEYIGFGGIRIEDDVLVTGSGSRVLGQPIPRTVTEVEDACAA